MTQHATATATRSLIVEREMPHAPEKVWRALTQGPLIADWLMSNDFQPVVGHRFNFRAPPMPNWNGVTDCEVLVVEPQQPLSYSWSASGDEAETASKQLSPSRSPRLMAARTCAWSNPASVKTTRPTIAVHNMAGRNSSDSSSTWSAASTERQNICDHLKPMRWSQTFKTVCQHARQYDPPLRSR